MEAIASRWRPSLGPPTEVEEAEFHYLGSQFGTLVVSFFRSQTTSSLVPFPWDRMRFDRTIRQDIRTGPEIQQVTHLSGARPSAAAKHKG